MSVADPVCMRLHLLDAAMFWTPQGGGGLHQNLASTRAVLYVHGWLSASMARLPGDPAGLTTRHGRWVEDPCLAAEQH